MERFWVPHKEYVWIPGWPQRSGDSEGQATLATDTGETVQLPEEQFRSLVKVTDREVEGVEDVCALDNVGEGTLLHTVRERYSRKLIYTNVSQILIAVNPFEALPIFSAEVLDQYRTSVGLEKLPPHIFRIGMGAMAGLRGGDRDQAVLISGESGAGKTESAKLVMSYISEATRTGSSVPGGLEEKVLRTNPVLEAFGNAMTARNNNSSRFGKWLDFQFSDQLDMLGCMITHYLLEVTRVCSQSRGERSYHIFFQLLQAREDEAFKDLRLKEPRAYRYLQGGEMVVPGVCDAAGFQETREALEAMGFEEESQAEIFRAVAAVLALGNCTFKEENDRLRLSDENALSHAAELLGLDMEELRNCMLFRKITVGKETTATPMRLDQANAARDGLSRMLYGLLFTWLISRINEILHPSGNDKQAQRRRLLGILDIAGFESFERNSLEQLLINLSNEHLQQHFNFQLFTSELEDYAREGLHIGKDSGFEDNADCLALLDGKGGILDTLDEEVARPSSTDHSFATSVLTSHGKHPRLVAPKFFGKPVFGIQHYAGTVHYDCGGFLAKNADRPPDDAMKLLSTSRRKLVRELSELLAEEESREAQPQKAGAKKRPKSSTAKFRTSLRSLVAKIGAADSHFIRCVKPNKAKVPGVFTSPMVMEQLLLSGVLEAVRIRQQGFPSRVPHKAFTCRYGFLCRHCTDGAEDSLQPRAELSEAADEGAGAAEVLVGRLLRTLELDSGQILVGKTKVFMKGRALSALEALVSQGHARFAARAQAAFRGRRTRRQLERAKPVLRDLQEWLKRCCPQSEVEARSCGGSCSILEGLGSPEAAQRALEELDALLAAMRDMPVGSHVVEMAEAARQRLQAELSVHAQLCTLNHSTDPLAIGKALARMRDLGLSGGAIADGLRSRADALKTQLPLIEALRKAVSSNDAAQCKAALAAAESAGLRQEPEDWVAELGGARLVEEAVGVMEALAARREAEARDELRGMMRMSERAAEEVRAALESEAARMMREATEREERLAREKARREEESPLTLAPEVQARLLRSLTQAAEEYEAVALEQLLGEAIRSGVDANVLEEPQKVLMQLQSEEFLFSEVEKATEEAETAQPPLTVLRRLQNLSDQIRVLQGNEEVARGALCAAQFGARRRLSTGQGDKRMRGSVLAAPMAAEAVVAEETFSDLRTFGKLKQPETWKGHRGSQLQRVDFYEATNRQNMLGHSKVAIAEALTTVRKSQEAFAVQCFRNVLFWMGDRPAQECQRIAAKEAVLNAARMDKGMRDEIYVQVLKQLSRNSSPRSTLLGWHLLLCLCQASLPSPELMEFVRYFAAKTARLPHAREHRASQRLLEQPLMLGMPQTSSTGQVALQKLESEASDLARSCLSALAKIGQDGEGKDGEGAAVCDVAGVVVYLIDGSSQTLCVPVTTSLSHLGALVSVRLGVKRFNDFGFFQLTDGVDAPRFLPGCVKVAELCSRWQQLREATGLRATLHWWRRFVEQEEVLLASDPVHAALTFHQALEQHLRRPVLWSEEEQLLRVAAAVLCLRFDCATSRMREKDFLQNLVPAEDLKDLMPKAQDLLRRSILHEVKHLRLKVGPTQPSLRRMGETFGLLQDMCLFGSFHWPAVQVLSPPGAQMAVSGAPERMLRVHKTEAESKLWVFVNLRGVHLLPMKGGVSRKGEPKKNHGARMWTFSYHGGAEMRRRTDSSEGSSWTTSRGKMPRASSHGATMASTHPAPRGASPCCGRLLRWGALPGLLQLVVHAVDPDRPREGPMALVVTLACPQAMDVAFAVHTALASLAGEAYENDDA